MINKIYQPRLEIWTNGQKRKQHGFIINPFRYAGSSPPAPPFNPSILSGLTFAFHAAGSTMYKGATNTSGAPVVDGDAVTRIDSDQSLAHTLFDATPTPTPLFDQDAFGSGLHGVVSAGVNRIPTSYAKPAGAASPSTSEASSVYIANNNALIIWAGVVTAAPTAAGNIYANAACISDIGQFFGLHYNDNGGGNVRYAYYNYDGSIDFVSTTEAFNIPVVIVCQHTGGNIRMAKNGVTWGSSLASGNTQSLTSALSIHFGVTGSSVTTGALVVCNAANIDADILTVVQEMGALVGLSL